jgi:hypothetical protein
MLDGNLHMLFVNILSLPSSYQSDKHFEQKILRKNLWTVCPVQFSHKSYSFQDS